MDGLHCVYGKCRGIPYSDHPCDPGCYFQGGTKLRNYAQRCATCRHNHWQNEAVGDCRVFHKDVLHHNIDPCHHYEAMDVEAAK